MKKVLIFSSFFTLFFSCKKYESARESKSYDLQQAPTSAIESNAEIAPLQDSTKMQFNFVEKKEQRTPSSQNSESGREVSEPKNTERKIIRTAQMRFKAAKTDNATYKVEKIAKQFGGYVTESQMNSSIVSSKEVAVSNDSVLQLTQYQLENAMVVRVPNHQLDTFLTEMSRIYVFLDHRRISADDVTLAYLSSHMKAKIRERAAQRIQNATDSKGKRLDDIVNAETATTQLHDEAIEQQIANAEKDFNIQYSLVNLNIYQDMDIVKTMKANPSLYAYNPPFFTRFKEAVASGWAMVLELFLGFISIWYLFLLGGLGWFLFRKYGKMLNLQRVK
jgi:Domain of unknown function (DUF4349)